MPDQIHLAVALSDAGWHPGAWREPGARPTELFTGRYWADLVREAESGALDLVTIDDGLGLQRDDHVRPDDRTDRVRGRVDAVLVANRVAPTTHAIGVIPAAITTHTEPFHTAKAIATLDYVAHGRAGVQLRVDGSAADARLFGRRTLPDLVPGDPDPVIVDALFTEAADYAEVLRRLWDSWEDGAEIRDAATGRFIDRDKLHYIDFEGEYFSVRGPSITPRPPQGQPPIAALGHNSSAYDLIGRVADLGFITAPDATAAAATVAEIDAARVSAGRADPVRVFDDLLVILGDTDAEATDRAARLDELAGAELHSDAPIFVGTVAGLADLIEELVPAAADPGHALAGVRLRPAVLPDDLLAITGHLVPELRRRGRFRTEYTADTLRGHLGLTRPANRYAA
ncbi:putative monooxygenase [Gordonia polyisoprenivorans VH2]|uniref:Putative monooxygenase n=1 Tax=Gordonia polyisoprenivorans (strain DSM 44266 / VH2) TaxID=1112204 RepID=H6N4T0_GORPV|nr:LLM class flavin-dependent oxidoreductase [Gordonia polyisoprenivorans]AFA74869.1 putative monooxygenase [Gordonia polyisoprenivorans VH2]